MPQAIVAYAHVARTISRFEPVTMIVHPEDVAEARFACGTSVEVVALETDDSWARDTGPTFVKDPARGVAGVHWQFNGWGAKYAHVERDAQVGGAVLSRLGMKNYQAPVVMEGGSFSVDGYGTLLTTEQCLLNVNRNPELQPREIAEMLAMYLGVRRVLWLGDGLEGDETDGHVDMVACFAGRGRVLLNTPKPGEPNHAAMQDNLQRLAEMKDAGGRELDVIAVPQPQQAQHDDGRMMPLSYINFYIANGAVIVPAFGDVADDEAANIIGAAFPGRECVQVPALDIARGGGVIHCITQQQPEGDPVQE
ncbi:Agmatine deiminase [Candidatus Phaeomarinobacter ectocarpi]|uniref:Agmatine deiminase n=2 Tax=Candidatus Phaeomarinibacter ectocarpi TaxID=1458461 RepID=X5MHW5_9HYPH|nr:Agmatine deiminase [Candidatus Phaeomarinobacter ectocarpi]